MAWETSNRRSELPDDWHRIRGHVLKRDGKACTLILPDGLRCNAPANQVDHIRQGPDHGYDNLRSLCEEHHKAKSSGEGQSAMRAQRKEIHERFRRTETHPGLIPPWS